MVCGLALAANAGANHSLKEEISIGPSGGNGAVNAFFDGNSRDGTHAFFETSESLVASDTDNAFDIYERVGNTTNIVSTGPSGGNGADDAFFDGTSSDGTKVFFDTTESLVPADTDSSIDVYMRSGGTTTLLSTGPSGGNGNFDVTFDGATKDGSHVYFETDEPLVAGDTNANTDIYDRNVATGATTLVTSGTGAGLPIFGGSSDTGSHVFFETDDSLTAGDTDSQSDVYDRTGGTLTQVSTGPAGGNGAFPASYVGNSADGSKVWFETTEAMVAGDTDTGCGVSAGPCNDVYERSGGTTSQISTGGNGPFDAFFDGASSSGNHVFFHTNESLVAGDTDARRDEYDRSGGVTTLLTTGPTGGNGAFDAIYAGNSLDGLHVFFETSEPLVAGDTDTRQDVYDRVNGTTTNQVSTGATGGNGAFDSFYDGSSEDGTRVFFDTSEQLEATDTDASTDVYERWSGATTQISFGPNGGNGAIGAFFDGNSADGGRVYFNTRESLITSDTDTSRDVYAATVAAYPRPRGASPMRASLVPAYNACSAPNSTHGAPLAFSSCKPPTQASGQLTAGTPDANGSQANFVGSVLYTVATSDVRIKVNVTDVRLKAGLGDYTGELQADAAMQVTDKNNGTSGGEPATGQAINFPVTVPCTTTASTTVGSTCSVNTTFNAVTPGAIIASQRAIWQMGQVKVFDGGPDGIASTGPNTLFAIQGVFIP
ncbi:MAG: hypothetical protein C5B48_14825 [Candidatus Rokuibacteriota bacterium]|nr:MAG: hypothetical protein C5B48_14825 [Candidatus Rokubacteria bacterium]